MIVANFTPDALPWQHCGICGTVNPGQIIEMEDNRARHVLNKMEARGLLRLQFGDNPKDKQVQAMEIYAAFWQKQITDFNQDQERRKNTNREPIYPTKQLLSKAKELGIEILGPWVYKPNENTEMLQMRKENAELRGQVNTLVQQMQEFLKMTGNKDTPMATKSIEERLEMAANTVAEMPIPPAPVVTNDPLGLATPLPAEFEKVWKTVEKIKKDKFVEWVMDNAELLQNIDTPPALIKRLEMKWKQVVPNTDWPLPK